LAEAQTRAASERQWRLDAAGAIEVTDDEDDEGGDDR
jgi:hypothetical protein